jgi:hypothetical protein
MHTLGNANLQIEIPTCDPQRIAGCGPYSAIQLLEKRNSEGIALRVEMQLDRGWALAMLCMRFGDPRKIF